MTEHFAPRETDEQRAAALEEARQEHIAAAEAERIRLMHQHHRAEMDRQYAVTLMRLRSGLPLAAILARILELHDAEVDECDDRDQSWPCRTVEIIIEGMSR